MLDDRLMPDNPRGLVRNLGVTGVLFLTLSVVSPASSVFIIVPGMLQAAGTGAVWAVALAGLICVATAFIYAELSSAWPVAGGEYVAVANTMGPLAGFVMLGLNVFNNLLFPPAIALGVSDILASIAPGLPAVPLAMAIIGGATLVALLRIRTNALLTGLFLLVEVAALVGVSWLGFSNAVHSPVEFLLHPVMPVGNILAPVDAGSIGLAATIAIFALNGYGVAVYFGEEMHEAPKRIAGAILWALMLTLVLEAVPLVAVMTGAADLPALLQSDDPIGLLIRERAGPGVSSWTAIAVVVAIVNAIIACILACARFFYSTGRDQSWGSPVDRWMAAIHPRFESPWLATMLTGGFGAICCLMPLQLLLVISGTGLVAIYAGIALATIVGRAQGATAHAPYRMPLYPLAPVVTLAALGYIVWTSWWDVSNGRPGLIATLVQIAISAGYYWLVLRPRGGWERQPTNIPG